MACRFLKCDESNTEVCTAKGYKKYITSNSILIEFCNSDNYLKCKIFKEAANSLKDENIEKEDHHSQTRSENKL